MNRPVELADKARAAGVALGSATAWDDIFFQVWLDRVEPHFARRDAAVRVRLAGSPGRAGPSPSAQTLAWWSGSSFTPAGLELANAFGELTDPEEQRARFARESAARRARGKVTYPLDEALLAALARMPPTAGVALGFDRLMMLVLGLPAIRDVMPFASDEV